MDSGQANYKIVCPLPGRWGQFASCEYPLNINFCSCSAGFIDLAWNLQMVEAEPEAVHENESVFQHRRVFTDKQR